MVIAIDGPAGSGKSSTAKLVAQKLGIRHLDTGAMYRAITLKCLRNGVSYRDVSSLTDCVKNTSIELTGAPPDMQVWMDGNEVTDAIRSDEVTKNVSDYCKPQVVRSELVSQQRAIGNITAVVCEGRDIGTVVFPDADLKIFMVASAEERARRRQMDFEKIGVKKTLDELIEDIEARDEKDSTREISPLRKAEDAIELNTTDMTLDEQVEYIVNKVKESKMPRGTPLTYRILRIVITNREK
jgi:cytidylate kinase